MRGCRGRASQHSRISPKGGQGVVHFGQGAAETGTCTRDAVLTMKKKKNLGVCICEIKMGGGGRRPRRLMDVVSGTSLGKEKKTDKRERYELRSLL